MTKQVLLTGVTGFVGKVVLAELLRRRVELGIDTITVLIRVKHARGAPAEERFTNEVAHSPALRLLERGWQKHVAVVPGDLERDQCGLAAQDREMLASDTTHIIHCAASVDFDLPIQHAAAANIVSALNVLELARGCSRLVGMVDVSTAYVGVWRPGSILERLAHLPRPATELLQAIQSGTRTERDLLTESGHPNTYTYTKCLAEHLLTERRGAVPLAIVRPSIICVAWQRPFPGWIDSAAAFAGCLLYTGLGIVKAWNADPANRLDVVPVDVVAERILEAAFKNGFPAPGAEVPIRFAAMGLKNAMRTDSSALSTAQYFRERPGAKSVPQLFIGKLEHGFRVADFKHRVLPLQLLRAYYAITFRRQSRRRIEKVDGMIRYLNAAFGYFTHHSFDFRATDSRQPDGFTPLKYIDLINRGIYRHLLKLDETQTLLAGKEHDDARSDLRWMREKPHGTAAIRALGFIFRKALRRCTSKVTFDRESFERAVRAAPPDALFVLAPSHRSYFDFMLTSYLCFQHPELGIPVPHIAAAEEFSRIPIVGRFLRQTQAFYIRRGIGKAAPELGEELQRIAGRSASLMFFVEGQRSRGRHMLPPKRGLLRGLQATGRTFAVLPIAIAYEQVPEQAAFDRELAGGARSRMSLPALFKWSVRLAKRQIALGRVHLACGEPLILNQATDVQQLASDIAQQLQGQMSVTRFHLRAFLSRAGFSAADGIDEAWLAHAIEQRGGRVLDSRSKLPKELSPVLQQNLQNDWMHWFYADALALYPNDPAIKHHVANHCWTQMPVLEKHSDWRLERMLDKLFEPIRRDYSLVTRYVREVAMPSAFTSSGELMKAHPGAYLLHLEDALLALAQQGVVIEQAPGRYQLAATPITLPVSL